MLATVCFSQDEKSDNKTFEKAQIVLTTGETLSARNVTVGDSKLEYVKGYSTPPQSLALQDVKEIQVSTKSYAGAGFLAGAAAGVLTMFIVEKKIEEPKTTTDNWTESTYYGSVHHSVQTTEQKEMAPGPKIAIVAGGALAGSLIGWAVKGGWQTVYPNENVKVSFDFKYINDNSTAPIFNIQYRFKL